MSPDSWRTRRSVAPRWALGAVWGVFSWVSGVAIACVAMWYLTRKRR